MTDALVQRIDCVNQFNELLFSLNLIHSLRVQFPLFPVLLFFAYTNSVKTISKPLQEISFVSTL